MSYFRFLLIILLFKYYSRRNKSRDSECTQQSFTYVHICIHYLDNLDDSQIVVKSEINFLNN